MKNLKRKMFKVIFLVMVLLLIFIIINRQMLISSYRSQEKKVEEEQKKQTIIENDQKLAEEMLKKQLAQANLFVQKINDTVQLGLVSYHGNYEITHDRTPDNNAWTEWLFDAKLQMVVDYKLSIAIATNHIKMNILNTGEIIIQYHEKDLYPILEIKKVTLNEDGSIFGKEYTSSETIALEDIAKEGILSHVDNTKLRRAEQNLSQYFKKLAGQLKLPESSIQIIVNS